MAELRDILLLDIDQALRQITEVENALNRALSQLVIDVDTTAAETQVTGLTDDLRATDRAADQVADSADDITDELRQAAKAADKLEDNIDDVKKSVGKAADEGKRFSRTVSRDAVKATDRLKGQIVKLGTAIAAAFAVRAIVQFAASSVRAASDLEESANAVSVVFGEATATIEQFGRTSATSVGLAQSEFNSLATNTGALLTNFGFSLDEAADSTITLTQRAADLASVFNTEVSEALDAINAALRGETEPIRRYGISLSAVEVAANAVALGLASATSAVDPLAKAASAVNLIMEQSAKVAGDFANTSEGLANQQRILKARLEDVKVQIGQAFIPALLAVAEAAPTALEAIADLAVGLQVALDAFQALPTAIQITAAAIPALISAFAVAAASPQLAAVLAALVALGTVLVIIGDAAREQQADVDILLDSLIKFGEITPEAIILTLGRDSEKDLARLIQLGVTTADIAAGIEDDTIKLGEFGRELRRLNREAPDEDFFVQPSKLFDTIDALEDLAAATDVAREKQTEMQREAFNAFEVTRFIEQGRRYQATLGDIATAAELVEIQFETGVTRALLNATDASDTANEAFRNTAFELSASITEPAQTAAGALESAIDGIDGVAESLVGVIDGLTGAVDPFKQAGEDIALTADQFVRNLEAEVRQLEEFEGRVSLLFIAGFENLAESLRRKGPELTEIAAGLLADPLQAQRAEDLLSGVGTEVGDEYASQIAIALAQFDFDDPATTAVLSFAQSLTVPGNVEIIRSAFEALLSSAFSGVSVPSFSLPRFDLTRPPSGSPGAAAGRVTTPGGGLEVNFFNSSFDSDPLGEAADAANIISAITGATGQFIGAG